MEQIDQLFEQIWKKKERRHRVRQILLWAPVAVAPMALLLAWAAGVGRKTAPVSIQPSKPPGDFFSIAKLDSEKYMPRALSKPRPLPANVDPDIGQANASLKHFQSIIKKEEKTLDRIEYPQPQRIPDISGYSVPTPEPAPQDPELDRLNELLSKVITIQHPEQVQQPKLDSSLSVLADTTGAVEAVTESEGVIMAGETMALRLEEPLMVHSVRVPAGTRIYGVVSQENERLKIRVHSLISGGRLLFVSLSAYDLDGQLGIYVPGSVTRDWSRESAQEALGSLALSYAPSPGAQAAGSGLQAMKTLLSRKVSAVKVVVRTGYRVYLK